MASDDKYRNESGDPSSLYRDIPSMCNFPSNLTDELSATEYEPIQVYLRIRNRTNDEMQNNVSMIKYSVEDEKHLLLQSSTSVKSRLGQCGHRFTFTKIFDRSATQEAIFQSTTKQIIQDFCDGNNRLIFNYGVTNAGKTYTMQGNANEPGIVPRSLDYLFQHLGSKLCTYPKVKPQDGTFRKLSFKESVKENAVKMEILKLDSTSSSFSLSNTLSVSRMTSDSSDGFTSTQSDSLLSTDIAESTAMFSDESHYKYCLWVSFIEIYSEQIFDLLDSAVSKHRKTLKLRESENGTSFLQGTTEIFIKSPDEAYKLLQIGRQVLRQAATKLNQSSSRSHCIFTIKCVRILNDDISTAHVNQLSFCDLAGSERCAKTQNVGERLREAGIINTSLMVLGRCINNLRQNKNLSQENALMVPFRDSKITKMFKEYLTGHGIASMLINVSPCADMFDETIHVLKFSANAKELSLPLCQSFLKKVDRSSLGMLRKSLMDNRGSIPWETSDICDETEKDDECKDSDEDGEVSEKLEEALKIIELLKQHVVKLNNEKLQQEIDLREELCTGFAQQLKETEDYYRDRIVEEQELADEMVSRRIDNFREYYENCPSTEGVDACTQTDATGDTLQEISSPENGSGESKPETEEMDVAPLKHDVAVETIIVGAPSDNMCTSTQTSFVEDETKGDTDSELEDKDQRPSINRKSGALYYSMMTSSSSISSEDVFKVPELPTSPVHQKFPVYEMKMSEEVGKDLASTLTALSQMNDKMNKLESGMQQLLDNQAANLKPLPTIETSQNTTPTVSNSIHSKVMEKFNIDILKLKEELKIKEEQAKLVPQLEETIKKLSENLQETVKKLSENRQEIIKKSSENKQETSNVSRSTVSTKESSRKKNRAVKFVREEQNGFDDETMEPNSEESKTEEAVEPQSDDDVVTTASRSKKRKMMNTPRQTRKTKVNQSDDESERPVTVQKSRVRKQLQRYDRQLVSMSPPKAKEEPKPSVHQKVLRSLRQRK